jgi:hypothetical protein
MYYNLSSMRLGVLLMSISVSALYLVSIGTQAYGSTQGTNRCDLSVNESCPQSSQAESETNQTPLILPDLSPTREDLNDVEADESANIQTTGNDNSPASTSSTDSDNSDNADNSDDEQETNNEDSKDSNRQDSGDDRSMIPFP